MAAKPLRERTMENLFKVIKGIAHDLRREKPEDVYPEEWTTAKESEANAAYDDWLKGNGNTYHAGFGDEDEPEQPEYGQDYYDVSCGDGEHAYEDSVFMATGDDKAASYFAKFPSLNKGKGKNQQQNSFGGKGTYNRPEYRVPPQNQAPQQQQPPLQYGQAAPSQQYGQAPQQQYGYGQAPQQQYGQQGKGFWQKQQGKGFGQGSKNAEYAGGNPKPGHGLHGKGAGAASGNRFLSNNQYGYGYGYGQPQYAGYGQPQQQFGYGQPQQQYTPNVQQRYGQDPMAVQLAKVTQLTTQVARHVAQQQQQPSPSKADATANLSLSTVNESPVAAPAAATTNATFSAEEVSEFDALEEMNSALVDAISGSAG